MPWVHWVHWVTDPELQKLMGNILSLLHRATAPDFP